MQQWTLVASGIIFVGILLVMVVTEIRFRNKEKKNGHDMREQVARVTQLAERALEKKKSTRPPATVRTNKGA